MFKLAKGSAVKARTQAINQLKPRSRGDRNPAATEVELVMSCRCLGGSDGQAGLGEAAVDEVAA
ncbi:hypothetical protein, partial [Streptomyces nigrescens]